MPTANKPYTVSPEAVTLATKMLQVIDLQTGDSLDKIQALAMIGAAISEAALQAMVLTSVDGERLVPTASRREAQEACTVAGYEILFGGAS